MTQKAPERHKSLKETEIHLEFLDWKGFIFIFKYQIDNIT